MGGRSGTRASNRRHHKIADLGAATSGATFFRSIGGAFGVSVFGAIFSNRLASELASALRGVTLPPDHPRRRLTRRTPAGSAAVGSR
jgi:hypothetical protein